MEAVISPNQTATAIWGRILKPDQPTLPPELARVILDLDFDPQDHGRVDQLSAKAREGTLTEVERAELEEYVRVNQELTILQSKARLSLKRAGLAAPA